MCSPKCVSLLGHLNCCICILYIWVLGGLVFNKHIIKPVITLTVCIFIYLYPYCQLFNTDKGAKKYLNSDFLLFYSKLAELLVSGDWNGSDYLMPALSAGWLRESWFSWHLVCSFSRIFSTVMKTTGAGIRRPLLGVQQQIRVLSSEVWLEKRSPIYSVRITAEASYLAPLTLMSRLSLTLIWASRFCLPPNVILSTSSKVGSLHMLPNVKLINGNGSKASYIWLF